MASEWLSRIILYPKEVYSNPNFTILMIASHSTTPGLSDRQLWFSMHEQFGIMMMYHNDLIQHIYWDSNLDSCTRLQNFQPLSYSTTRRVWVAAKDHILIEITSIQRIPMLIIWSLAAYHSPRISLD